MCKLASCKGGKQRFLITRRLQLDCAGCGYTLPCSVCRLRCSMAAAALPACTPMPIRAALLQRICCRAGVWRSLSHPARVAHRPTDTRRSKRVPAAAAAAAVAAGAKRACALRPLQGPYAVHCAGCMPACCKHHLLRRFYDSLQCYLRGIGSAKLRIMRPADSIAPRPCHAGSAKRRCVTVLAHTRTSCAARDAPPLLVYSRTRGGYR